MVASGESVSGTVTCPEDASRDSAEPSRAVGAGACGHTYTTDRGLGLYVGACSLGITVFTTLPT